jgi:hypothetical protein
MQQNYAGLYGGTGKIVKRGFPALSGFCYRNGYTFQATDLGNRGVKIELFHEHEAGGAIILPPKEVGQCGRWLLRTLGQDRHGLPEELREILKRLSSQQGASRVLRRGDKKKIKDAIRVLRS